MINELKVNCFLKLTETMNFTEAGKRLYISQQAVSRHIANLEEDIGVRLFDRSRNSVELTEAGRRFYQFFRDAGIRYNALLTELTDNDMLHLSSIRIGYQNWTEFGPALGTALSVLREKNPGLCLLGERHSPAALIALIKNGALDMILIHERFISGLDGYNKLCLLDTPMQVVIARDDPLCGEASDYRVFAARPLLIDAFEGEARSDTVERAKKELIPYGFTPREIIVTPNRDSIYTEAELGRGIFLSSSMAQASSRETLVRFDTDVMEGLFCVWNESGRGGFSGQYAKQLKQEYCKMAERFLYTRRWCE